MKRKPKSTPAIMLAAAIIAKDGGMMAWESNGETLVIGDMPPDNAQGIVWARRYFGVPVILYKTETKES